MIEPSSPTWAQSDDFALDQLLARARWDEAQSSADLQRWQRIWHRRVFPWRIALAAAASLMIIFTSGALLMRSRTMVSQSMPPVNHISKQPLASPGRAADLFERLLVIRRGGPAAKADRRRSPSTPTSVPPPKIDNPSHLAELQTAVMSNHPAARRAALATMLNSDRPADTQLFLTCLLQPRLRADALAQLRTMPNPPCRQLIAQFDSPLVSQRLAAAQAVGAIVSPGVREQLKQMMDRNDHRREALAALLASPAAAEFNSMTRRPPDAEIEATREEMHQLFGRKSS